MSNITQRRAERDAAQRLRIEEHVKKLVDSCPPLTPERRDRLALLLAPRHEDPQPAPPRPESLTAVLVDQMEDDA